MTLPTDFEWSYTDEPHATRRKLILAKYPQVRELMGPHWFTKYLITATVLFQVWMCYMVQDLSWPVLIAYAYTLGGCCNHSLTLAMHEVSHNLAFRGSLFLNRCFGVFTNLPLGIPAFASFKRYHTDHHKYQGEDALDTDIPTIAEGHIFTTAFAKILWVMMQPLFYALRPMFTVPKIPGKWEIINIVVAFTFDYLIWHFFSLKSLMYLVLGTLLGMGLHPMAGHFIAEHYTFVKSQETYSYYGPMNWFSYNVGYHNEHHDFPLVAGFRLPQLRAMAPEFYDTLPHHSSWTKVIWQYIVDPNVGPFSRVKRATLNEETLKRYRAS